MVLLDNPIRSYAWGSPTVLPELLGRAPTGEPQAELWAGAHPAAPSRLVDDRGVDAGALDAWISASPDETLGADVAKTFGGRLPFLLKILTVNSPLSIQVHPSKEQAEEGFAAENTAGLPLDAASRRYRDANHKPEMVVAVTEFEAFAGFRDVGETAKLLRAVGASGLDAAAETIEADAGLERLVRRWMTMPADDVQRVLAELAEVRGSSDGGQIRDIDVVREVAHAYPDDRGVLLVLLLNRVQLQPGEAMFIGPGVPHAYLSGVAIEPQASSDNTLRAGLTVKHVDVDEVLRLLDYRPDGQVFVTPERNGARRLDYRPQGVAEFAVSRLDLSAGDQRVGPSPAIVLPISGTAAVAAETSSVTVPPGRAAFVSAVDGEAHVTGEGVSFAVTTALHTA